MSDVTPGIGPSYDDLICEVSKRLAFNEAAYGKTWTGEDEDTKFLIQPVLDEVERLRNTPKGPQQLISEGKDRLAVLRARMDQVRARRDGS